MAWADHGRTPDAQRLSMRDGVPIPQAPEKAGSSFLSLGPPFFSLTAASLCSAPPQGRGRSRGAQSCTPFARLMEGLLCFFTLREWGKRPRGHPGPPFFSLTAASLCSAPPQGRAIFQCGIANRKTADGVNARSSWFFCNAFGSRRAIVHPTRGLFFSWIGDLMLTF